MFFAVKATTGQEHIVAVMLYNKWKAEKIEGIYSIITSPKIKGYIIVEGEKIEDVQRLVYGMKNVKGIIRKPIPLEEIKKLFEEKKEIEVKEGMIVEIISGPFKGEKAKVMKIDESKDELTVELIDIAVPIPINIKKKNVKVIQG